MQSSTERPEHWEPSHVVQQLRALIDTAPHVSDEVARQLGVNRRDIEALTLLLNDDPLGPVELGRRLGISGPAATQLVNRLEDKGHVHRVAHPADRRKTIVEVTSSARVSALSSLMPMLRGLEQAAARLNPSERAAISRFLTDCLAAMHVVTAAPTPAER